MLPQPAREAPPSQSASPISIHEAPADAKTGAPKPDASALKNLRAAITWLTASLAGLSAILYAFGLFATLGFLDMLGLDPWSFHYDANFYIQRGGSFAFLVAVYIVQIAFKPVVAIGVFWMMVSFAEPLRQRMSERARRSRLNSALQLFVRVWRGVGVACLFLLLILQLPQHLQFPSALTVADVLHGGHATGPEGAQVLTWIRAGQRDLLSRAFAVFAYQHAFVGLLLLSAWAVSFPWRPPRSWLVLAPFIIVFLISFAWLPFAYGKLALPMEFAEAKVTVYDGTKDALLLPAGPLFLMGKNDGEFLFWAARESELVWLPTSRLGAVEIGRNKTVQEILRLSAPQ